MAIEVISGNTYSGSSRLAINPENRTKVAPVQEAGVPNINISDIMATPKSSGNYQNEQGTGQKDSEASAKQIINAISRANNKLKMHKTRCEFSYHEETRRVSIKVLDKDTEEVIREIPPEESLEMLEKMWELAGILIDEKR
ncbi:MAG TPA: flagellar protein FlaG [Mobilitalea sp.]|nr:flagellar protein FlaG [Mobilitalea sp.]